MRSLFYFLALAVVLTSCEPSSGPVETPSGVTDTGDAAARPAIDLEGHRLVDLTRTYDETTLYWPTSPSGFELQEIAHGPSEGGWFYAANQFCSPEHGGTHLDAPLHFAEGQHTTDSVPLETLIGPAVVLDVSRWAEETPDYALTLEDLNAWEAEHGEVPKGSIVLLRTGWGERWPDRKAYLGDDTPGDASNLHFPAFGVEATEILVGDRGAVLLGLDTASLDVGSSTDFQVHRVAAAVNVPGLENLANLGELPATGAWVIALPMKIGGGTGGPVRVVALVPR